MEYASTLCHHPACDGYCVPGCYTANSPPSPKNHLPHHCGLYPVHCYSSPAPGLPCMQAGPWCLVVNPWTPCAGSSCGGSHGRCLACRNRMVPGPASLIVFQQGKTLPPCDEWGWKSARQRRFWPNHSGRAGNRSSETGSCQKVMEIIISRCHQNRIDLSCLPFLRIRPLLQHCGR